MPKSTRRVHGDRIRAMKRQHDMRVSKNQRPQIEPIRALIVRTPTRRTNRDIEHCPHMRLAMDPSLHGLDRDVPKSNTGARSELSSGVQAQQYARPSRERYGNIMI